MKMMVAELKMAPNPNNMVPSVKGFGSRYHNGESNLLSNSVLPIALMEKLILLENPSGLVLWRDKLEVRYVKILNIKLALS